MGSAVDVSWVVAFAVVTITVSGLSGKARLSAPVALVVIGAVISFVPGIPPVRVDPELLLFGLLPPLLFASAIRSPLRDVRVWRDGGSILLLSVVLVIFSSLAVGFALAAAVPAIGIAAAIAFGAVVAPTDAVAVGAVSTKVKLPRRIDANLQGESLLNDATSLVVLNASVAAIAGSFDPGRTILDFAIAVIVGIGVGLVVAVAVAAIRMRVKTAVIDTSLSLLIPYLAFIPAEFARGSGVLAVVVCGIYLSRRSAVVQFPEARIAERFNWRTIRFLLENAIFLFIGLNLASIVEGVSRSGLGLVAVIGLSVGALALIAIVRFAWVMAVTGIYRIGPRALRSRSWPWRNGVVVAAAGTRGVVTLAAAFLLPPETPLRPVLQFLALVVVIGTLLETLLLPTLLRGLKLTMPDESEEREDERKLQVVANRAGLSWIESQPPTPETALPLKRLLADSTFVGDALSVATDSEGRSVAAYGEVRQQMIRTQRSAVLAAAKDHDFSDRALQKVLSSLDAEETALTSNGGRGSPESSAPEADKHEKKDR